VLIAFLRAIRPYSSSGSPGRFSACSMYGRSRVISARFSWGLSAEGKNHGAAALASIDGSMRAPFAFRDAAIMLGPAGC